MALNKVAQQRYDELRVLYNYDHASAEAEAKKYAKAVTDAKPKKKRTAKK